MTAQVFPYSVVIVNEHIKHCQSCKSEFEAYENTSIEQSSIRDEKIIIAIKRSVFITQLIALVAGAIIGSISLIVFKKKCYLAPIAIFILTYLWQTAESFILDGFQWYGFYGGLYYNVIYSVLVIIGTVIASLLKFTFRRSEKSEKQYYNSIDKKG